MKKNHYVLIVGIIAVVIAVYGLFDHLKEQRYQTYKMKKMRELGVVLWFGDALTENKDCFTDDMERQLSFYHTNPQTDQLIPMLRCLLDQPKLLKNWAYSNFVTNFFAAALQRDDALINSFASLKEEYSGTGKQVIERILEEARKFQSPDQVTQRNLDLLWIEFMATGGDAPLRKMTGVLALPETEDNKIIISSVMQSLVLNAARFPMVKKTLEKMYGDSDGRQKEQIKKTLTALENLEEQARIHIRKGINYANFKQYDKALDEYYVVLELFPYYPAVYANIANIYEYKGDKDKAFELINKAVRLDPEDYVTSYNLGRHYFMRKQYDEAIQCYSKALANKPMNASYNHALARAYQMKGDDKNAVAYFEKYLEYAPHGEFETLVKKYLASVNVPMEEDRGDVVVMLKRRQYKSLNEQLGNLLRNKGKDSDGHSLLDNAYQSIVDSPNNDQVYDEWLPYFNDWAREDSSSHFSNACLGMFYVNYAWKARGRGWASSVVEEGQKLFRERLGIAREYLERAYNLDASDPIVPASLIRVARGLGLDHEEMERQFQRGINADKTEFLPYYEKLLYLMPKWHGSEEEMFQFARDIKNNAPPGSLAPRVLAQAHWEMYSNDNKSYFRDPAVWEEVRNVYSQLLETFPDSKEIHNWLARSAYLAGDYKTARKEFEYLKDDMLESCWRNMKFFEKAKKEVFEHEDAS